MMNTKWKKKQKGKNYSQPNIYHFIKVILQEIQVQGFRIL